MTQVRLRATGDLPHGGFADNTWRELSDLADGLVTPWYRCCANPRAAAEVELALDDSA